MSQASEGAIQFELRHESADLPAGRVREVLAAVSGWRRLLRELGLLGRRPDRYDSLPYGNVSLRLDPAAEAFFITGTQTSDLDPLRAEHLVLVESCEVAANRVHSRGRSLPSSETLTHAAIYATGPAIRAVLHVHSPEIWSRSAALGLVATEPAAACGTVEMAGEVARVAAATAGPSGLVTMGGHLDGVLAWGPEPAVPGGLLLQVLARAYALPERERAVT